MPSVIEPKPVVKLHHPAPVTAAKASPLSSSHQVATGCDDFVVRVWNITEPSSPSTLHGHFQGVNDVAWSPDGALLASASDDKTVRIWDPTAGKQLRLLAGHSYYVVCVAFNHKGNLVLSGSADETLRLWDIMKGETLKVFAGHSDPIVSCEFSHDSTMVLSASQDGLVRLWDVGSGHCLRTVEAVNKSPACCAHFTPNSKYLLISTLDGALRMFDYLSYKCIKTYREPQYSDKEGRPLCSLALAGDYIVYSDGSTDSEIDIIEVQSKNIVGRINFQQCLSVSYLNGMIALAGVGGCEVYKFDTSVANGNA